MLYRVECGVVIADGECGVSKDACRSSFSNFISTSPLLFSPPRQCQQTLLELPRTVYREKDRGHLGNHLHRTDTRKRGGQGRDSPQSHKSNGSIQTDATIGRMINDSDASKRRSNSYALKTPASPASVRNNAVPASPSSPERNIAAKSAGQTRDGPNFIAAAAHATIPSWANMVLMASLILGGCCANVGRGQDYLGESD